MDTRQDEDAVLKMAEEIRYRRHNEETSDAPAREMTVAENIDNRIKALVAQIDALNDLRNNLPAVFLNSGYCRIAPLNT